MREGVCRKGAGRGEVTVRDGAADGQRMGSGKRGLAGVVSVQIEKTDC